LLADGPALAGFTGGEEGVRGFGDAWHWRY
jgi:hypothetical protein